jgi:hypothetical protein
VGRIGWGERPEAWGVGRGLGTELGEVKIGAGAVTDVHGLAQALLGVITVEDDGVEDDGDEFYNDLNNAADEGP